VAIRLATRFSSSQQVTQALPPTRNHSPHPTGDGHQVPPEARTPAVWGQ
jgi:hypothetical protein